MATEAIKLTNELVYEVSFINSGNAYKAGTQAAKDGKKFSQYRYDEKVFTIPDDHTFNNEFNAGKVKMIKLNKTTYQVIVKDAEGKETKETRDGYSFDTFINKAQWAELQQGKIDDAKVDYQVNKYKQLESVPMTEDLIAQLQNA